MPDDAPPSPPRPPHLLLVDQNAIELRETLDRLVKTPAETCAAAFHARDRMDLAPVAAVFSESMDKNIGPLANQLHALQRGIETDRKETKDAFDDFLRSTSGVLEQRRCQIEDLKTRNWIPLTAFLALVLVLSTAALTPWLVGKFSGEMFCEMAGGFWFCASRYCGL